MKAIYMQTKYVEQLSPEELHKNTNDWLSELKFVKEEHRFFKKLIGSYPLQLIDSKHFNESKELVKALDALYKETANLVEIVTIHNNDLNIMVDNIHQPKEETSYRKEHKKLAVIVHDFFEKNKSYKSRLFNLIKEIIKEQKQKQLLK